jgi:hypothetical protein
MALVVIDWQIALGKIVQAYGRYEATRIVDNAEMVTMKMKLN